VTGFTDAEGCFTIKITQSDEYIQGWRVQAQFQIKLHHRDLALLNRIKDYFPAGTLTKNGIYIAYTIKTVENLTQVVIPHFDNYPLLTQKLADFQLFKQIVIIMSRKGHLNQEGFEEILSLKANLNLGVSEKLKIAYPNIVPAVKPQIPLHEIKHPYWLTGFIDGEGSFFITLHKYSYNLKSGRSEKAGLLFQITQHSRDTLFMKSLIKYLNCGRIRDRNFTPTVDFIVNRYIDINSKIIPFLERYPLQSVKQKDYKDFCKAAEIIASKQHLTQDGLEKIKVIKNGMNKKTLNYV